MGRKETQESRAQVYIVHNWRGKGRGFHMKNSDVEFLFGSFGLYSVTGSIGVYNKLFFLLPPKSPPPTGL